jgi:hypothetical protein
LEDVFSVGEEVGVFVLGIRRGVGGGWGYFVEFGEIEETDKVSTISGDTLEIEIV